MKKRYSIWVYETGATHSVELLQVDSNPEPLVKALRAETLKIKKTIFQGGQKRKSAIPRYSWVKIVDNGEQR